MPWYPNLPGRVADAQNRSKNQNSILWLCAWRFDCVKAVKAMKRSMESMAVSSLPVFPVSLRDVVTGGFLRKAIFIAYGNQWVVASKLLESCEQPVKIMNACWSPRMYALSKTSCSLELGWHQWLQLSLVLVMSARWVLSCFVCFA